MDDRYERHELVHDEPERRDPDEYDGYDPDEELRGSTLVPATRLGRLSVRLATAMMAPLLVFWLFAGQGLMARGGNGGLPVWVFLGPAVLLGGGACAAGVASLVKEERALLVYLATSIGATVAASGSASILHR